MEHFKKHAAIAVSVKIFCGNMRDYALF